MWQLYKVCGGDGYCWAELISSSGLLRSEGKIRLCEEQFFSKSTAARKATRGINPLGRFGRPWGHRIGIFGIDESLLAATDSLGHGQVVELQQKVVRRRLIARTLPWEGLCHRDKPKLECEGR